MHHLFPFLSSIGTSSSLFSKIGVKSGVLSLAMRIVLGYAVIYQMIPPNFGSLLERNFPNLFLGLFLVLVDLISYVPKFSLLKKLGETFCMNTNIFL